MELIEPITVLRINISPKDISTYYSCNTLGYTYKRVKNIK